MKQAAKLPVPVVRFLKQNPSFRLINISELRDALALQTRAISVQQGLPKTMGIRQIAELFMDAHPEYAAPSLLDRVENMIKGRHITDEVMLGKYEVFLPLLISGKLQAA